MSNTQQEQFFQEYTSQEAIGAPLFLLISEEHRDAIAEEYSALIAGSDALVNSGLDRRIGPSSQASFVRLRVLTSSGKDGLLAP